MKTLKLRYDLADLPSSQHRAGLAGLVAMLDWRRDSVGSTKGIARLAELSFSHAILELDQAGLEDLFDHLYAATEEDRPEPKPRRNKKTGEAVLWRRTEEREVANAKTGKTTTKTYYLYPQIVPRGAFLLERDPTREGEGGLWVKLWRDMTWQIMRGVPATRKPYEERAQGKATTDAKKMWAALAKNSGRGTSIELPSTYFLGAQAQTAEGVAFRDRAHHLLLLHFWSLVAQVYVPQVLGDDGRGKPVGYAVVVPDILDLEAFAGDLTDLLLSRSTGQRGYRPSDAVVDLPLESALELMWRLRQLVHKRAGRGIDDIVTGFDVLHVEKDGNNVRVRSVERLPPSNELIEAYVPTRELWSLLFRQQWLRNVVSGRPRWSNFDRICATTSIASTFNDYRFRHDAREMFRRAKEMTLDNTENASAEEADDTLEALVLQIAKRYVASKVERKHGLKWNSEKRGDFAKHTEAVARDAFLAVRSRSDADFPEYFTATLCSVAQFLPPKRFEQLSRALLTDPARVRTLTLMALSAAGYVSTPKEKKD